MAGAIRIDRDRMRASAGSSRAGTVSQTMYSPSGRIDAVSPAVPSLSLARCP
jgi:hypothetical protein